MHFFHKKYIQFQLLFMGLFIMTPLCQATEINNVLLAGGCASEYYLMQDIAEGYNTKDNMIIISKTGNMIGLQMLVKEKLDIAFLSMPHQKLAKKIHLPANKRAKITSIEIATEPILIVVDKRSQISALSKQQIIDIYNGVITNWKEVGGADLAITVGTLNTKAQSGLWAAFKRLTIGMNNNFTGTFKEIQDPSMTNLFLRRTKGGIAYVGHSSFNNSAGTVVTIDNAKPSAENFNNGTYPFVVQYYLSYNTDNPQIEHFISFVTGPKGQEIINKKMLAMTHH